LKPDYLPLQQQADNQPAAAEVMVVLLSLWPCTWLTLLAET
jgi:hypothetical protein